MISIFLILNMIIYNTINYRVSYIQSMFQHHTLHWNDIFQFYLLIPDPKVSPIFHYEISYLDKLSGSIVFVIHS